MYSKTKDNSYEVKNNGKTDWPYNNYREGVLPKKQVQINSFIKVNNDHNKCPFEKKTLVPLSFKSNRIRF